MNHNQKMQYNHFYQIRRAKPDKLLIQRSVQWLSLTLVLFLCFITVLLVTGGEFQPFQPVMGMVEYVPSSSPSPTPTNATTAFPSSSGTPAPEQNEISASSITLTNMPSPTPTFFPSPSVEPTYTVSSSPSVAPKQSETAASSITLPNNPSVGLSSTVSPSPTQTPTPTAKPIVSSAAPKPDPTRTPGKASQGKTSKNILVCIDPGHGGRYPGTVSPFQDELYEKNIVLDMGLRLKKLLEKEGIEVIMTRETDNHLNSDWEEDVRERPKIANSAGATFFISIHVNAMDPSTKNASKYNGTEIYHYGKDHGSYTSKELADIMGSEINKATDTKYNGVIQQNFGVLRLSNMPALLVETAYITNPDDHKRLISDTFRQDMAECIFHGTLKILKKMGIYKEN